MSFSAEILPDFAWGSANPCEVVPTFKNVINFIIMWNNVYTESYTKIYKGCYNKFTLDCNCKSS